jgi:hypothetical protein
VSTSGGREMAEAFRFTASAVAGGLGGAKHPPVQRKLETAWPLRSAQCPRMVRPARPLSRIHPGTSRRRVDGRGDRLATRHPASREVATGNSGWEQPPGSAIGNSHRTNEHRTSCAPGRGCHSRQEACSQPSSKRGGSTPSSSPGLPVGLSTSRRWRRSRSRAPPGGCDDEPSAYCLSPQKAQVALRACSGFRQFQQKPRLGTSRARRRRRMSSISVALWSISAEVARSSSSSEARW